MPHPDVEARIAEGERLLTAGDLPAARTCFEAVLAADAENVFALNDLALVHAHSGRADAAVACLERALTARPEFAPAFFNLLDVVQQTGGDAVAVYSRYAAAIPPGGEKDAYRQALGVAAPGDVPAPAPTAPAADDPGLRFHTEASGKKHLLILAQPRSGTTIFWELFRQDARLTCFDEPFRPHLRHHVENQVDDHKSTMAEYLARPELIRKHWSALQPYEEVLPHFLGHQEAYLKALLGEGEHVCMDFVRCNAKLEHLREIAPDALIIHLVRDPRAWVTSHLRPYGKWLPNLPAQFFNYRGWFDYWSRQKLAQYLGLQGLVHEQLLQIWDRHTTAAEKAGPDVTLQFEHLATHPEAVVRALYERLDLPYQALDFSEFHPPNPPHRHDDPRWAQAVQDRLSPLNRRFVYDFDAAGAARSAA